MVVFFQPKIYHLLIKHTTVEIIERIQYTMAKSKLIKANKQIAEKVTGSYKAIEDGVTGGFKRMTETVVSGYTSIEDRFVDEFLTKEDETVEEAKARLRAEHEK